MYNQASTDGIEKLKNHLSEWVVGLIQKNGSSTWVKINFVSDFYCNLHFSCLGGLLTVNK